MAASMEQVDGLLANMEALADFTGNDIDLIYERLTGPLEELEERFVVSSMVQDAVSRGALKALEEDCYQNVFIKDEEIRRLKDVLKDRDATVCDLRKVIDVVDDGASASEKSRSLQLLDFMQESQQKWKDSEVYISQKESELEGLASIISHLASTLDEENKRASLLEEKLKELNEQETLRTAQISSMQHEITKVKVENTRLKRQARIKAHEFEEVNENVQLELQQQIACSEKLSQEKKLLEKKLMEKENAFVEVGNAYQKKIDVMDKELQNLRSTNSKLEEAIAEQNLLQTVFTTYMEEILNGHLKESMEKSPNVEDALYGNVADNRENSCHPQKVAGLNEVNSIDDLKDLAFSTDITETAIQVVIEGWYKEVNDLVHKLTFELAWKDEGIFIRDRKLESLKQAVDELENDYATLMSICLTLFRDQNDNDALEESRSLSVHELGRRKLIELTEVLNLKDTSAVQADRNVSGVDYDEDNESVSTVSDQETSSQPFKRKELMDQEELKPLMEPNIDEQHAVAEFKRDLESEIVSELFLYKYKEALEKGLDLRFLPKISDEEVIDDCHNLSTKSQEKEGVRLLQMEIEEQHASLDLQHKVELEIISDVLLEKYQELEEQYAIHELEHDLEFVFVTELFLAKSHEAFENSMKTGLLPENENTTTENVRKKISDNFGELEAQLESFLEMEACRLERIRSGCSTSIAKCEFKLESLMKSLADQVNEMKEKISFIQEAIKQQEWKHMVEEDILVLVLCDALAEMQKKRTWEDLTPHASPNFSSYHLDGVDASGSPTGSGDYYSYSKSDKGLESLSGFQDKDKVIILRRGIEELRKEKVVTEQKLDEITEELYSLKRQFWKEKEIWVSKLSQRQRKEVEAQVEAMSKHFSTSQDLEDEFKREEIARLDAVIADQRKEWMLERESLLRTISAKDSELHSMTLELEKLKDMEKTRHDVQADLMARILELKAQANNLSNERLNQEYNFAKFKQAWQTETECIRGELDKLLDRESSLVASESQLLARVTELEKAAKDSELTRLEQESMFLKVKQELQGEIGRLREEICKLSEKEKRYAVKEGCLSAKISELDLELKNLQLEKDNEQSSFSNLRQELETKVENLRQQVASLLERERALLVTESTLSNRISELQRENDSLNLSRLELESTFSKSKDEWEFEREQLLQIMSKKDKIASELAALTDKQSSDAKLISQLQAERDQLITHVSARIAELETEIEISRLSRFEQESSILKLKQEWQTEKERLLERISENAETKKKLIALTDKDASNAKLIRQLQAERDKLLERLSATESLAYVVKQQETAVSLAITDKEEEVKRRKILESQLQELHRNYLELLNRKSDEFDGRPKPISKNLEHFLSNQINQSLKAYQKLEEKLIAMLQVDTTRLDRIKIKCKSLRDDFKMFSTRETQYKQRLAKELSNLQKAEAEVDLLGDEVESLLDILEKVQEVFEFYAPVLHHYPKMAEAAKHVKQEIQLRINPKYGA